MTDSPFQIAFPDFPIDAFPALPDGFTDSSWRNDICPSMINESKGLRIWIDYPERQDREFSDSARYVLVREDSTFMNGDIALSENWADILAALAKLEGVAS